MPDTTEATSDTTSGSLIDDGFDATATGGDTTGATGDGDTTTTDGATGTDEVVAKVLAALESKLEQKFDSTLDRRVNQTIKAIEKRFAGTEPTDGKGDKPKPETAPAGVSTETIRATRLAAREYIGDHLRFVSAEERALASDLVHAAVLEAAHGDGIGDEDRVGRDVAKRVAESIKGLRTQYEALTLAGLRKRGVLVDDKPGQTPGQTTGTANADSEWAKGAEIAKRLRPVPQPAAAS